MPIALNFIYLVLLAMFSPVLVMRSWLTGKYRDGWREKLFGRAPYRIGDRPCLWFHAVSVGEVLLLRPLLAELARRRPGWDVVVSTTTSTGLAVARKTYPDLITFYAPLDFSWATRRAVSRIRPTILALVELELWPNLVRSAKNAGSRVAIINGRLSQRSHRGYRKLKGPLSSTILRLDSVSAQSDEYAERFRDLGVPHERVHVTGSVKYDGLESDRSNSATVSLKRALGLSSSEFVFVAGSTMEGEEEAAYHAYVEARKTHPGLRMVVVPRHLERFDKVAAWLESQGESVVRRSLTSQQNPATSDTWKKIGKPPVVLVDTLGELSAVWGLADFAFVGGSLFPGRGGQNMMEPAAYGASVFFGPYTSNFRETVNQLLSRDAARRVSDADELAQALSDDLEDPDVAHRRGEAARRFVLAQNGASLRTLAEIDRLVEAA